MRVSSGLQARLRRWIAGTYPDAVERAAWAPADRSLASFLLLCNTRAMCSLPADAVFLTSARMAAAMTSRARRTWFAPFAG